MKESKNINKINERLYEENINKQGLNMKIIEYNNANNIKVLFDDGYIANSCYRNFKLGKTTNKNYSTQSYKFRIGETNINSQGYTMTIVEYIDCEHIKIIFDDDKNTEIYTCYSSFKEGRCRNPNHRRAYNIGYFGKQYSKKGLNNNKAYSKWHNMIERCYSNKYDSYKNCYVCEEWLNFANFEKWYNENYYEVEGEDMCLDKDILVKGNNIYSPNACIFVPKRINTLFVKRYSKDRNKIIGVFYDKTRNQYQTFYGHNHKFIGRYDTKEECFNGYKIYVENYIKQVAEEYKDKIPQKLYEAMYRYEVEITD